MKYTIFNESYDTEILSALEMKTNMQQRLDAWLGVGKVTVDVNMLAENIMELTLWRTYGSWYEDPKRFSNCNDSIFSFDKHILLGTDYQTGTEADFETLSGRYLIFDDVDDVLYDMKQMAKKHHGSRIKSLSVDNNLDHITLRIELVKYKNAKP